MEILGALAAILIIATPILAIAAFVRVHNLSELFRTSSQDTRGVRLDALERRLSALEKAAASREPQTSTAVRKEPVAPPAAVPATLTAVSPPAPPPTVAQPPVLSVAGSSFPASPEIPKPREGSPATPEVSVFAAPPLHSSQHKDSSQLDWETLIAGRWLNRIGIIAVIVGVTFFLKYAFDNNWIGPSGRVGIGLLLGASMLPWSQWLLRRGYAYFSEGIAGLGAAVMYLSIWAGCHYYTLFSRDTGFYGMIVVTAGMAAVALGRNAQRIALLSLIGGFLTPELVSSGKDEQVVLFGYLLILGAGLLVIELRRNWRSLTPVSFVLSMIYFWGWYEMFYRPEKLERTLLFATLLFILYAALPVVRAIRFSELNPLDILVTLVNAAAYFGALYTLLWPKERWPLTLFVLALSGAYLFITSIVPHPKTGEPPLARLIFAGLALTFATLAIPIRLDGRWISMSFSVEGAVLIWTSLRAKASYLRTAGLLLLAIVGFRLLVFPLYAPTFLWNERFAAYLVLVVCLAAVLYAVGQHSEELPEKEMYVFGVCAVGLNVYALIALSLELWDYFGRQTGLGIDSSLAQHLALSLLWTAYASVLIALGIQRQSALLRWQALALFGMVVIKVFIYDSSYLERFYRIVSFLMLGLVLLAVSFLYQRKVARGRTS
jgi:uncharacterized membrane protein